MSDSKPRLIKQTITCDVVFPEETTAEDFVEVNRRFLREHPVPEGMVRKSVGLATLDYRTYNFHITDEALPDGPAPSPDFTPSPLSS